MKRILSLLFAAILAASLFSAAFAARDAIYDITLDSQGVYLINNETDTVLYRKEEDTPLAPAALTEIVTALCALEASSSPKTETVIVEDLSLFARIKSENGINMQADIGETFTVYDLCVAMLLGSYCDAAELLAWHTGGGSVEAFVERMNRKCADLGMKNTHFTNAHGLFSDPEHYSTAHDLAIALRAAMQNETFAELFALRSYKIPATRRNGPRKCETKLALFDPSDPELYCEGLAGAKGGFTDDAGRCLASYAERDGVSYTCVLMGANLDTARSYPGNMTVSETHDLYSYVYSHYDLKTLYRKGELVTTLPIKDSAQTAAVAAGETVRALVRVNDEWDQTVSLPEILSADEIQNGKVIGTMTIRFNDEKQLSCPLVIRYNGEAIHVQTGAEKTWNSFAATVSGLLRTDRVFVVLLILLLVVIGGCIPAVKITQALHNRSSHLPKH